VRAVAALVLLAAVAGAEIVIDVADDIDDPLVERATRKDPRVKALRPQWKELRDRLGRLKLEALRERFGEPVTKPKGVYVLALAQPRVLSLSGVRHFDPAQNRDHVGFHVLDDVGALEIYYQIDGETPATFVVYLKPDAGFVKLDGQNLDARLAWDARRWKELLAHLEERRKASYPWEVDPEALAALRTGPYSLDPRERREAFRLLGTGMGLTCEEKDYSWTWRRPDGTVALRAAIIPRVREQVSIEWYAPDGVTVVRSEGGFGFTHFVWRRADTGKLLREEKPGEWSWFDAKERPVRTEIDDDGDGIPDLVADGRGEPPHPLPIEQSWAVHPDRIPEALRLPDQPDRRVPVRKVR